MYFEQIYEEKLSQYAYLIGCPATGDAIVIDPMRDIDTYIEAAAREDLSIVAAADTHIHADFLSGLREFAERGKTVYASDEGGEEWNYNWLLDSNYDYELLTDGDTFQVGNIEITAWFTPGHTPEHLSYEVTDRGSSDEPMGIVTGDFLFVGDLGRPDLLESAGGQEGTMSKYANKLYQSVTKLQDRSTHLQVWPGHGAGSACGKSLGAVPMSTVGYELEHNPSIQSATSREAFVDYILKDQPEPPYYFKRMKQENRDGPDLIEDWPQPYRLSPGDLGDLSGRTDVTVLDTRERESFAAGHLPGSLLSPIRGAFNTVAGCYVNPDQELFLIVDKERVEEAVTHLVRIGLDPIEGFAAQKDLKSYGKRTGDLETLPLIDFDRAESFASDQDRFLLDVRRAEEYQTYHLPDARNISHTRLLPRREEIPMDKEVITYCRTGGRSTVAAAYLKSLGHTVTSVYDDIEQYQQR